MNDKNTLTPECPRDENRCNLCLKMAQVAFVDVYVANHGMEQKISGQLYAENVGLRAPIEEAGDILDMPCAKRQERAKEIGSQIARRY